MENHIYKEVIGGLLPQEDLSKLGLDADTRDLLVKLLDVGIKSDPLYIRFMAYSQLTPEPPEETSSVGIHLPHDDTIRTVASLFPRETQFLSKGLQTIAIGKAPWQDKPGGAVFGKYLRALSEFYNEKNVEKALEKQQDVEDFYAQTLQYISR